MTEAWQVRLSEQQELVRKLAEEVRDIAYAASNYDRYIMDFLIAGLQRCISRSFKRLPLGHPTSAARLLKSRIAPEIGRFARVSSEKKFLLYILFHELESSFSTWAGMDYLGDQITNPRVVFGVPSAMTELGDG